MKSKEIAEMFSQGKNKGKVTHLFIEGNAIYSYGTHFPIAIRLWDGDTYKYVFNSDKYSVTTSRQQNMVLRAIGEENVIKRCNTQEIKGYLKFTDVKEVIVEALD